MQSSHASKCQTETADLTHPRSPACDLLLSCISKATQSSNSPTLPDSATTSEISAGKRKSLLASAAGPTSNAKVFQPYWNEQCAANASRLLSAIGIDSLASASISLNQSSSFRVGKSWCSIRSANLPQIGSSATSWLPSLFPQPDSTASVCTSFGSKQIYLKPSASQKIVLKRWLEVYRWAFNKTVNYKEAEYLSTGKSGSYMSRRKQWAEQMKADAIDWSPFADAPAHTIYGAMMDADNAYKNVISLRSKGEQCNLPRCRRHTQRSCYVLGNAITNRGIYIRKLGPLKSAEPLPDKPSDSRLIYEFGRWYLRFPYQTNSIVADNQSQRVCSVDPGVRTFATIFSPGGIHKIGSGLFGRICRLSIHLDNLISKAAKAPCRKSRRIRSAISNARRKIHNLVNDLHYQAISWLCRNFDIVVIPESDFTSAVSKVNRKIKSKTARSLLTFAFARFRDRLLHKLTTLGKVGVTVCEAYTSKTANWTGEIVKVGGSKFIRSAGQRLDRDVNGALGILLKASLLAQPRPSGRAFVTER